MGGLFNSARNAAATGSAIQQVVGRLVGMTVLKKSVFAWRIQPSPDLDTRAANDLRRFAQRCVGSTDAPVPEAVALCGQVNYRKAAGADDHERQVPGSPIRQFSLRQLPKRLDHTDSWRNLGLS